MLDRDYTVKFITSKNSFIYLSDQDFRLLDQDILIRLSYGLNKTSYFSLGPPLSHLKAGELGICSLLGKELGILKNDTVSLSSTTYISSIKSFNISPVSIEDYEVLELLSDTVQETLLHQVKIVHNHQKLVIWISNSLHITVNIDGVKPISPGRLENLTEVVVIQPDNHVVSNADIIKAPNKKRNSFTAQQSILNNYNQSQTVFRLHPISDIETKHIKNDLIFKQPFNVFISKQFLPMCFDESLNTFNNTFLVNLRPINQINEQTCLIKVRLFALEDILDHDNIFEFPIIYVTPQILNYLNTKNGAKIILEQFINPNEILENIEISTTKKHFGKAAELVRKYLTDNCKDNVFLIKSNFVYEGVNGFQFSLKFTPDTDFTLIKSDVMRKIKLIVNENELIINDPKKDPPKPEIQLCLDCCNFRQIISDARKCLDLKLIQFKNEISNVLIIGKAGAGKTALINFYAQEINISPFHIHVECIDCKKLKGKSIDSLQKVLNAIFLNLIYFQPSLLILDDLHVVAEKVIEGDAPSQDNIQHNKISLMLADLFEEHLGNNCIAILATCDSLMNLNTNIFTTRGKHLFKNVFSINDLIKVDRIELTKYLFIQKEINCNQVDFNMLGIKTEGFVIQDLLDFVDKALFGFYKDNVDTNLSELSTQNCEEALKNTASLSLRDVQLHHPGDRDFSDVGGLEFVKKIMIECMLWPAQYPNIFGKAPLRLQSGLLLYGPPGTGKTILAGAAAKHCNLRLISIKGPELLSKYIGASEQAVRDVFQKAQSARPCILFFDEFDSLAPRRGHDSTGVTDRVVNQFLTQLDGVESLNGVCVLAATSRPDLLDPALLRPGRLDRQILCPLPDKEARLAILKALSKSVNFANCVDLARLADHTEGYSGADLQAVLYTAQLTSVEHLLEGFEVSDSKPVIANENFITQKHLDDAVNTTRPSLTFDEKRKYERIYTKFQGKGDLLDFKNEQQRATLA